jgi:hypothetical protein
MFSCPNCAQVLGDYPDAGVLVMQCARCTFKYEVSGGRVVGLTSWKVEVRPATGEARAIHARCFELALAISVRETVRFTFASERDDDWIRTRMATLNSDVYADRIRAIDLALTTLDAQLDVDGRLATEYDRTVQMLDIEYESNIAADALPEDSASIMDARLVELHGVEELRAETTRRLAANAEVERLLRHQTP